MIVVGIKLLVDGAKVPVLAHQGDSCVDLVLLEGVWLTQTPTKISLGFALLLPPGYHARIWPRSGKSLEGVHIATGTIDNNYRGEVCLIASRFPVDLGDGVLSDGEWFPAGTKLAQLEVLPVHTVAFVPVNTMPSSVRGAAGFGSSDEEDTKETPLPANAFGVRDAARALMDSFDDVFTNLASEITNPGKRGIQ